MDRDAGFTAGAALGSGAVQEFAVAVNYYLRGHHHKLTLDATWTEGLDDGASLILGPGAPGSSGATGTGNGTYGVLVRLQWQLAL